MSRGNHRAFSRKRTRTEEKVRTWSKSALRAKIRPYFEKNGTCTRFDWMSCRRRRLRRCLFWSRLSLFALWEVFRSILKSVLLTPSFRVGIEGESGGWRAAGACKQGRGVQLVEGADPMDFSLAP